MGLEGGFPLHWSRLVDLPIALLILAAGAIGLRAAGGSLRADRLAGPAVRGRAVPDRRHGAPLGSEEAILPAFVLGAAALYFTGEFEPGAIDHHNVQLVLVLAMLNRLQPAARPRRRARRGLFAALSIAIGMETAPYVAVAGAGAALLFLVSRARRGPAAQGFGIAFFRHRLAFLGLVHPSAWTRASCDALSCSSSPSPPAAASGWPRSPPFPPCATSRPAGWRAGCRRRGPSASSRSPFRNAWPAPMPISIRACANCGSIT
jgi:hypothetical protein